MAKIKDENDGRDVNVRLDEARQEVVRLEQEQSTGSGIAEYPKFIPSKEDPSKGFYVVNAEQEADVKAGKAAGTLATTFDKTPEEQEAERIAKAEADKDAARAKSRLAGPEGSDTAKSVPERKAAKRARSEAKAEKPGLIGRAKAKLTGKGK